MTAAGCHSSVCMGLYDCLPVLDDVQLAMTRRGGNKLSVDLSHAGRSGKEGVTEVGLVRITVSWTTSFNCCGLGVAQLHLVQTGTYGKEGKSASIPSITR